jgi:general secretion pathway protein I
MLKSLFTHKIKHDDKAFTLLEVMIAMSVLALTLVTIFQLQSQSISMETQSRFLTTASLLAQSKMAELENLNNIEDINKSGNFGEEFPDYNWDMDASDTEEKKLKKITITITNEVMKINNVYRLVLFKSVALSR